MSDPLTKKSKLQVIGFALTVSIICSLLITLSAVGLKGFQQANMELDRKINVLKAAGLIEEQRPPKNEILELYDAHIKEVLVNSDGQVTETYVQGSLHLYLIQDQGTIKGYILPINTKGLWGKIQGYLAFENDGQTVSGFSVFSHSETPGLGGEIESSWFRQNFIGKKILNSQNQFVSVGIAKGKVKHMPENLQDHYVDGISGATLTGKYLSEGIKQTIERYDAVAITFRQKQLKALDTKP